MARGVSLALLTLAVVLLSAAPARAGEDAAALATDPVTLSEIEHDDLHASIDTWGAWVTSANGTGARDVAALSEHVRIESPLASRKFYLHLDYQAGSAQSPAYGGIYGLGGNAAIGGRAVWSHAEGVAFGGDLSAGLPTAHFTSLSAQDASLVLASMRPWDYDAYRSDALVLMPAIDARAVLGPVTLQLRHQLDWSIERSGISSRGNLATLTTVYGGWRVHPIVSPGVEVVELYLIDATIPDNRRSQVAVAPGVRFNLGRMSPELGVLTNIGTPAQASVEHVFAFRVSCIFSFEPTVVTP